jgi:putative transcriptional regulator
MWQHSVLAGRGTLTPSPLTCQQQNACYTCLIDKVNRRIAKHTCHSAQLVLCYSLGSKEATISNSRLENRLKVARAERGLSQLQLASLAGVTRQTISSIETGQYVPSALLAFLLAERLEKRVDELFTLHEGDNP